jgi:serine/threonine protein kinase
LKVFCQILKGFKEIHKMRFLHRDIKAENIFVNNGVFKIADFGLAKN